ncbi:membrane-spanning 4-domains subfamily A member 4A-like [Cheilinus undulatus]|uniref:membrane-spanning 4-domains subfamily A member 4A-like n=1 Tax=Cheilinus undulatus TaxID=241271 RepID=UPI001BD3ABFC|nr:membrane-spanning 4-domains subfamily A member 4A-like [Cheilinus undulatus]
MSVSRTTADGVTVITLTSDPKSLCPPFCQVIKNLCYSPPCFSLSQDLRRVQGASQSILGALQILIGLLNIALGAIVICNTPLWPGYDYIFPFWIGGMFILFGGMCILSEKHPSPCVAVLNVILNLSGAGFAIAGIILNSINLAIAAFWLCEQDFNDDSGFYGDATPSPRENTMTDKCLIAEEFFLGLYRGIFALMIALSVLEFFITISSAVLGIKALCSTKMGQNKSPDEQEHYQKLQKDVTSNPVA